MTVSKKYAELCPAQGQTLQQNKAGGIGFVAIPYRVFTDPGLTPIEKLAIGRLMLYAGKDGRCYPSYETLARELCITRRQAIRVLAALKRKRRLAWTGRIGRSNNYSIELVTPMSPGECHGCHQTSDTDVTLKEVLKDQRKTNTDLDCAPMNYQNRNSSPHGVCVPKDKPQEQPKQYPLLRQALFEYFKEPGQEDLYPSDRLVVDVMDAAGDATEQEVVDCLLYLYNERGLRPGTRNWPRHWSWFPTTVADHFNRKREREAAANPSGYHEWEGRNDYRLSEKVFDQMTEAIEIQQPNSQMAPQKDAKLAPVKS